MKIPPNSLRIGIAAAVIVGTIGWLAFTGYGANKSYYVTIAELGGMGDKAYHSQLRVEGFVQPGSIEHNGPHVDFVLNEFESHSPKPPPAACSRSVTKAPSRPRTPSKTMPRPSPKAPTAATASSTPPSSRPSAPASTRPPSPTQPQSTPKPAQPAAPLAKLRQPPQPPPTAGLLSMTYSQTAAGTSPAPAPSARSLERRLQALRLLRRPAPGLRRP